MPFQPGQSGNPAGRPPGIIDKRIKHRELFLAQAPELINKVIDMAMSGDMAAMKLCIDRIVPKINNDSLECPISIGNMKDPKELLDAGNDIINKIADGSLNSQNGKIISSVLDKQRKLIETVELQTLLENLQETIKLKK